MGVIVTGMHRSGTSAVARVLHGLGLASESIDMGPAPDNPRGFFESHDVMEFNDDWLHRLGGAWWAPPQTSATTWSRLDPTLLQGARQQLELFDPASDEWFVKDPRLSLLLPLWDRLTLRNLPVILCVRDPRDSANSLHLRDGVSQRRALALWMAYVHAALIELPDRRSLIVDYGQMPSAQESTIEAVVAFLASVGMDMSNHKATSRLAALIEPELRRSHQSSLRGVSGAELDSALELYWRLAKAHADPDAEAPEASELPDWVAEVLEELRESYDMELRTVEATARAASMEQQLSLLAGSDGDIGRMHEELSQWQDRLGEVNEQCALLESEATRLRDEIAGVLAERESLLDRIDALEVESQQAAQHEAEVAGLSAEVSILNAHLLESREAARALEADLLSARQEMESAQSGILRDLADAVAQRSELADRLVSLESDLEAMSIRADRASQLGDQVTLLTQQLQETESKASVLGVELARSREALEAAEGEISRARDEAARSAAAYVEQISARDARLAELEESRLRVEQNALLLQGRLSSLEERHEALKDAAQALHGRLVEEEAKSGPLLDEISHLQEKLVLASNLVEELQTGARIAEAAERDLSDGLLKAQAREVELTDALAAAEIALKQGGKRLRKELQRSGRLESRLQSLRSQVAEADALLLDAEEQRQQMRESLDTLARSTADLNEALAESEARGQRTAEALAALSGECERLRAQLVVAHSRGQEANDLRAHLLVERAQRVRLQSALEQALTEGQELARQLDGIVASRSYKYGRRLTAPGRFLFGTPSAEETA